jgi:catechol 2,3-dioxygenase-like lactoylglutathione lyase family enzyme
MPLTELNHYLVVSKDLERSMQFYRDVLGMQLADRPDFGFPGYWLKVGDQTCLHLASQDESKVRDQYLLKDHPPGTTGSGSVDHIAFLATNPKAVRDQISHHKIKMHFRSLPDAKLFQIFLKDPDEITIELNFFGEQIDINQWHADDAGA